MYWKIYMKMNMLTVIQKQWLYFWVTEIQIRFILQIMAFPTGIVPLRTTNSIWKILIKAIMGLKSLSAWIFWRTFYFNSSWDSPYFSLSWAVSLLSSPISFSSFALFSMLHRTQHFSHCGLFSINLFCIWLTCFGQPFMNQFFDCLEYAVTPSPLVEKFQWP